VVEGIIPDGGSESQVHVGGVVKGVVIVDSIKSRRDMQEEKKSMKTKRKRK
jgi:hypothetical protein